MAERKDYRITPQFLEERSRKVIDLIDLAESSGRTDVRIQLEGTLTRIIKTYLKGKLPEEVLSRISNVQVTTNPEGAESE